MQDTPFRVTIIGGGITGLSTAWYLQQQAHKKGPNIQVTVLEASDRWGGKIRTEKVEIDGASFVVESGPDSFITQKPAALQLAKELGLNDQLIGINDEARHTFVLNHGKPKSLPEGIFLIVPTWIGPFLATPL